MRPPNVVVRPYPSPIHLRRRRHGIPAQLVTGLQVQPWGRPGQNLDVITYTTDVENLRPDQLGGFFVGWPTPPSRHQFAAVLRSSYRAVVALDSTTGCVVGFITAISDGVLTAFLPWLEVLPDYQGRGIGAQLLGRMLTELDRLYSVDLICGPELRKFYERAGMIPLQGMGLRDTDALDGESK